MNIARWGEPFKCECGKCDSKVMLFLVNEVDVGRVFWESESGPFYGMSNIRHYGAATTLEHAKSVVESFAAFDVYTYPTRGNA